MTKPTIITLKRGSIYLKHAVYELYFLGLETIILLRRENDLLILPVHQAAAGGYVLKLLNGVGDRIVTAPDFFRENGIADDFSCDLAVVWVTESAGLRAKSLFRE